MVLLRPKLKNKVDFIFFLLIKMIISLINKLF